MAKRTTLILALALVGAGGGPGGGEGPTRPAAPATPPPTIALADPIDYGAIGPGRLCFERKSPAVDGSGVFVLDGSARRAWGFKATADFAGGLFEEPAISPDGLRIAYSSLNTIVTFWDIFVIPADGGTPVLTISTPENESLPTWSLGSVLLWWDGSGPYRLTREAVSVTGARVVAAALEITPGLYIRTGEGGYALLVASRRSLENFHAPAFSPDGLELAWIRVSISNSQYVGMEIIVADTVGDHQETIVSFPLPAGLLAWRGGNNLSLAWSPDGTRLAFNRPTSPTTGHVFVVERHGGRLTQITSMPGVGDRSISWSYLPRP